MHRIWLGVLLGLTLPGSVAAQQDLLNQALELERRGSYAEAAGAFGRALDVRPGSVAAALGLERSLTVLGRTASILPRLRAALDANQSAPALYGIAIRAWTALNQPDSAARAVERWATLQPEDEMPYREWGGTLLAGRERAAARSAYLIGRKRLGRPDALAAELAQVAVADADYSTALKEWMLALGRVPSYRAAALASLNAAPRAAHAELLSQLDGDSRPEAQRLGASLKARWGDPVGGFRLLAKALPVEVTPAITALRQFLDQLRGQTSREARHAGALALEALASRTRGLESTQLRLQAAQAYAEAGERESARRMLAGLTAHGSAPPDVESGALATLINVLIEEGETDEAERRLRASRQTLSGDDYTALRRQLVLAWVRAGQLERAESSLAADSTVDGLALAGRVSLYRGDRAGALVRLKAAGPFAGTREEATARTALLALLQTIEADSVPVLGRALLALDQGDTTAALAGLDEAAAGLPPAKGGAELRLLAGRLERSRGNQAAAERLFRAAIDAAPVTAPAAALDLARLLSDLGQQSEAVAVLEDLILKYPESALVPQARRALNEARGAVPKT